MQNNKLLILLVTLGGLIAITYLLVRKKDPSAAHQKSSGEFFLIPENADPDHIALDKIGKRNLLTKKSGTWFFNDTLKADPALTEAMLQILKKISVKRKASRTERAAMPADWVSVNVLEDKRQLASFQLLGDKKNQTTYFRKGGDEEIWVVEIPGYTTYLGDIFYYEREQWRSRNLFVSTWQSLQALEFMFPGENESNYSISYEGNFFSIPGIQTLDTAKLINFFDGFSQVQIDEFLKEDSIKSVIVDLARPALILNIIDADTTISKELKFYSDISDNDGVIVETEDFLGVISADDFKRINVNKSYFRKQLNEGPND